MPSIEPRLFSSFVFCFTQLCCLPLSYLHVHHACVRVYLILHRLTSLLLCCLSFSRHSLASVHNVLLGSLTEQDQSYFAGVYLYIAWARTCLWQSTLFETLARFSARFQLVYCGFYMCATCVQVLCTVECTDVLSKSAVWTFFFIIVLKHIPLLNII